MIGIISAFQKQQSPTIRLGIVVLRLEGVTLINLVGLVVLLHVDLQVAEITSLLKLLKVRLGLLLFQVLLGGSQVIGKLELLLLCVQNRDPLISLTMCQFPRKIY